MLDIDALDEKRLTMNELVAGLSQEDLARATHEMIDGVLAKLEGCDDADVQFVPSDPGAFDSFASSNADVYLPWTLGHVIVHATASSEEAAFLAVELARGVPAREGRSRYEVPWRTVTTIEQCRLRLEESRRMRKASLEMWPDPPHLDNTFKAWYGDQRYNGIVRFVFGLRHDDSHLAQIAEIVQQARAAR